MGTTEEVDIADFLALVAKIACHGSRCSVGNVEVGWQCLGVDPWDKAVRCVLCTSHGCTEMTVLTATIERAYCVSIAVDGLLEFLDLF